MGTSFQQPSIGGHGTVAIGGNWGSDGLHTVVFRNGQFSRLLPIGTPVPGQPGRTVMSSQGTIVASDRTMTASIGYALPSLSTFYDANVAIVDGRLHTLVNTASTPPDGGSYSFMWPMGSFTDSGSGTFLTGRGVYYVDTSTGTLARLSAYSTPAINSFGTMAMVAPNGEGKNAILRGRFGESPVQLIAVDDLLAADTVVGTSMASLNNRGDVTAVIDVKAPGSTINRVALLRFGAQGVTTVLAKQGDPIPGLGSTRYGRVGDLNLYCPPAIDKHGNIAVVMPFQTGTGGYGGEGLVYASASESSMRVLVKRGDVVATPAGPFTVGTFTMSIGSPPKFASVGMNGTGTIVTLAYDYSTGRSALLGYDPERGVFSIVSTGESVRLADGTTKVVASLAPTSSGWGSFGGEDGRTRCLDDYGAFVYCLTFTDNTYGVFTTWLPEPATMTATIGTGVLMLRRRCGKKD